MAVTEVGQLRVKIDLDSSGLVKGLNESKQNLSQVGKETSRQMQIIKAEFGRALASLDETAGATEKLKLKADFLGKKLDEQKKYVAALNNTYQKSVQALGESSDATQRLAVRLAKAREEEAKIEAQIKKTNQEILKQSQATNKLKTDFEEAGKAASQKFTNSFDAFKDAGQKITVAGAAMGGALGLTVKQAMDFDSQMSKVQALSGATGEEFEKLRKQAIQLGADTSFSASQAASAMQMLAQAGMNTEQIMAAMPGVLSAAAASGAEMSLVAETMATTLNSFGLKATKSAHVADILASAANQSAIDLQDLAYSIKYIGPVAHTLGISLEEVTAAVIEMGNAGIKGEQAGTTLRMAMLRLVDPPKDAKDALNAMGVSVTDQNGKFKTLGDIIGQLEKGMSGMTEAQKAQTISTIFGTEAMSGMAVIIGQGKDKFNEYTKC